MIPRDGREETRSNATFLQRIRAGQGDCFVARAFWFIGQLVFRGDAIVGTISRFCFRPAQSRSIAAQRRDELLIDG